MKLFKITLVALATLLMANCSNSERSMGFTNWSDDGKEYKFFLGTDQAVQVVRDLDKAWAERDYEGMRAFLSDTAKFYWPNGVIHNGTDDFIDAISANEVSENAWTLNLSLIHISEPTRPY